MLIVALAGCGFQPLYGRKAEGGAAEDLAAVKIALIEDRAGQQLRNFLLDRLNPGGEPAEERYTLSVVLDEARQELAIRKDETATRANLVVSARYQLSDTPTGSVLFKATSTVTTSFNIVQSDFATVSAETDARRRAAREISDEIRSRLALFFNRRSAQVN